MSLTTYMTEINLPLVKSQSVVKLYYSLAVRLFDASMSTKCIIILGFSLIDITEV